MVEANQEIARKADSLPASKKDYEVACQHQQQHEENEEVEVGEVAPEARLFVHVPDRIDMDKKADASDDEHHQ